MADKPQKLIQRGKGKALNALAAASGRPILAAAATKAAVEAERAKAAAEEERFRAQATPLEIWKSLSEGDLNKLESFRRCAFPSRDIEEFVARELVREAQRRYDVRRGVVAGLGVTSNGDSSKIPAADDQKASEVTDASSGSEDQTNNTKRRRKRTKKSLLNEESKRRRVAMDQPLPYILGNLKNGASSQDGTVTKQQIPPLDALVVPDSASEIVAVVSTMAKCYAQRLVAAARRVADAEDEAAKLESEEGESELSKTKTIEPLQLHHYMEAHRHRVNAGIDPGFWMQDMIKKGSEAKGVGAAEAAAVGRKNNWNNAYLAALAAQDAYDEMVKEEEEADAKEEQKMDVEEAK
jgi:hypothetical protein